LIEQLGAGGAAGRGAHEHRVGGKQGREHHDVAEEEDPEAVGNHDALRRGARFLYARQPSVTHIIDGNSDVHRATSGS
jgi:hypothetical protein